MNPPDVTYWRDRARLAEKDADMLASCLALGDSTPEVMVSLLAHELAVKQR